jgi:hypothetical protein
MFFFFSDAPTNYLEYRINVSIGGFQKPSSMEQAALKNVNNCLNTNIYSYLETSGGKSYNLFFNVLFDFSTPVLIRYLWQLKAFVIMHWCIISAVLLRRGPSLSTNVFVIF